MISLSTSHKEHSLSLDVDKTLLSLNFASRIAFYRGKSMIEPDRAAAAQTSLNKFAQNLDIKTKLLTQNMSATDPSRPSKRKWDQPAPGDDGSTPKAAKTDDSRTASEAAAAAAAIAAKIAAQFASGALGGGDKEHDAEFTHNIDINDVRNRYLLTRGSTQDQVCIVVFFLLQTLGHLGRREEPGVGKAYDICLLDSRRNWSFGRNEGCVVPRSIKSNGERSSALYSHISTDKIHIG